MKKQWKTPELIVLLRATPGDGTNVTEFSCKMVGQYKQKPDRAMALICVNQNNTVPCDTKAS